MKKKKILFITWDGPETNYMESLFMPIFKEISKKEAFSFHIIQFTWNNISKIKRNKESAEEFGFKYSAFSVSRKPLVILGSIYTLLKGIIYLKKYIKKHNIDIIMPRSTMPLVMVNKINCTNNKIIFDSDGLPLEERLEYSKLTKKSLQFKWLKKEELMMLKRADAVITRSQFAIDTHVKKIGGRKKFKVVLNGRDDNLFKPNRLEREFMRKKMRILKNERVFIYCGSLGDKYDLKEMCTIFREYLKFQKNSKFIILTGNLELAKKTVPQDIKEKTIIRSVTYEKVPNYLNISDVAFALIKPSIGMKAASAIKLGEYLLMGLPTIASKGVGNSELVISKTPNSHLFDYNNFDRTNRVLDYLKKPFDDKSKEIRKVGIEYFSLRQSVESYINVLNKSD